jgi:HSP20 family molecular chaperone IbpA
MTTRAVLFDSPFLLGFDHTRALIERAAKAAGETYPPYNVEARGERGVRITLAVAGFSPDQLEVTVEDRQLTVAGKRTAPEGEPTASSCIAASPPAASCAASCWPTAWRSRPPAWSTACCTST